MIIPLLDTLNNGHFRAFSGVVPSGPGPEGVDFEGSFESHDCAYGRGEGYQMTLRTGAIKGIINPITAIIIV